MTDYTGSYNGFSFGVGTDAQILVLDGFEGLPSVNPIDTQRNRDHGEFYTPDFAGGRDVGITLLIVPGTNTFANDVEAFAAATIFQAAPLPLVFNVRGQSRQINCRPRRRTLPVDSDYVQGYGVVDIEFHANDPRWYDTTLQTATVTPSSTSTGLVLPLTMPLSLGGAISGGSVSLNNAGNFPTRPTCTITGPCTTPHLLGPNGESLTFDITLTATDTLVVDFLAKTVVLNGTASRYNTLAQPFTWFELAPGANTVTAGASLTNTGFSVSWSFRSAWI